MSEDIFSWFIIILSLVCPKPHSLLTPLSSDPLLLIAPVRSFRFIPDSSFICTTSNWPLNPVGPTVTAHPGSNHFSSLALNPLPLQHLVCCLACKRYRISNHWMNKGMNTRLNILKKKLISFLCGLIFLCHYPKKTVNWPLFSRKLLQLVSHWVFPNSCKHQIL